MKKEFHKLVRDLIPDIIESRGERVVAHMADDVEYATALTAKLHEEITEFLAEQSLDEAADVIEVLRAICVNRGLDIEQLEGVRQKKAKAKGSFDKRIILDYTE